MTTSAFYDTLSSYYHLIFPDWQASVERQGRALNAIIRTEGGPQLHTVLDSSCGIGTQSLGLAALGYEVTASDLSPGAVQRARSEARQRGLSMQASVADMRSFHDHRESSEVLVHATRSACYAVSIPILIQLMEQAKFQAVRRIDGEFFQPIIVGHKQ